MFTRFLSHSLRLVGLQLIGLLLLLTLAWGVSSSPPHSSTGRTPSGTPHVSAGSAPIAITKSVSPSNTVPGATVTYTLAYSNTTAGAIPNVSLYDVIPAHTTYATGSASGGGTFNATSNTVTWALGTLAANQSGQVTFQVSVNGDTTNGTTVSNTAQTMAPPMIPTPTPSNTATFTVSSGSVQPNLTVSKSAAPTSAPPGATVTYTLAYGNSGTGAATTTTLSDVLPATLTYVAGSASGGGSYNASTRTISWAPGTVAAGANGQVTFQATIAATATVGSTIANTASIASAEITTPVTSNTANVTVTNPPPALTISKSASVTSAPPGTTVTYTLSYGNTGGTAATNVTLTDALPAKVTYVTGSASNSGSYNATTRTLSWALGGMNVNQTGQVTFQVTVDGNATVGSTISNTASIACTEVTTPVTSNTASYTVAAAPKPTLTLTKSASTTSTIPGATLTYTLAYGNTGPGAATNVTLTDVLPTHLTYVAGSAGNGGSYNAASRTLSWALGGLSINQTGQVTFQATVDANTTIGSTITNTASIASTEVTTPVTSNTVSVTVAASGRGDWWMFQHDPQHTGRSPFTGPKSPVQKWAFPAPAPDFFIAPAAIAADGTLYVGISSSNNNNRLVALTPNGTQKWSMPLVSQNYSAPAIAADGTIYVADDNLYAFKPDGSQKWALTGGFAQMCSPAIASDGIVYIGDGNGHFCAVNPDGSLKWTITMEAYSSSPALATDGTIYVGAYDNKLHALNPADGSSKWSYPLGGGIISSPTVAPDGTIYIGSSDYNLYALKPDGTKKWAFPTGAYIYATAALGADGTIYFGNINGQFYALNPDGSQKWVVTIRLDGNFPDSPIIGADGTIYIGSSDGHLYALNPADGSTKWQFTAANAMNASPAIGADGTIYVGSMDGKFYAITNAVPNLTLTKSASLANAVPGAPITYTLAYGNTGNGSATNVALTDVLPAKLNYLAGSASNGGSYNAATRTLSWGPGALNPGGNGQVTFQASVDASATVGSTISNTASIASTEVTTPVTSNATTVTVIASKRGDWWMFQHDPQHTGRSAVAGPSNPVKKWAYAAGGTDVFYAPPAMAADGTIYIGITSAFSNPSPNYRLVALNPNGTAKWAFPLTMPMISSPAIAWDGTIYVAGSKLYAINPDGTQKWAILSGIDNTESPVIGSDGTIYVNNYAVNPDGTVKWTIPLSYRTDNSAPAIGPDGTIYTGSQNKYIYAFNPDGSQKWAYLTTGGGDMGAAPSIAPDGTIYVVSRDKNIYALRPDGTLKWTYPTGNGVDYTPALGADGTIYFGTVDRQVVALNPDGTKKWSLGFGSDYSIFTTSPIVGADGVIYIGSQDGNFYAINPNGTLKWTFSTQKSITASAAIGADGTVYIGSQDGYFYAIANPAIPALTLTKSVSATSVFTNTDLTYTISYGNAGSAAASNVTLTDVLPTYNATYVSGSADHGGMYNGSTNALTWSLGTLAAGGSGQVTFKLHVDSSAGVAITNTASITCRENTTPVVSNTVSTAVTTTDPGGYNCYYLSQIDNTLQNYSLYVPTPYDPAKPHPVIFIGHGYGSATQPSLSLNQVTYANTKGILLVGLTGRGNTFYDGVGEVDFLDVLADLRRNFNIDTTRLYFEGTSMGATGAYRLGVRHPDLLAAVGGVDGFADYREWYTQYYGPGNNPSYVDPCRLPNIEMASCVDVAEGAKWLNMYMFVDTQDQNVWPANTTNLDSRLTALDAATPETDYVHVTRSSPNGHGGSDTWTNRKDMYDFFLSKSQPVGPSHVVIKTTRMKYGKLYWASIDRVQRVSVYATLDAVVTGNTIAVTTTNVLQYTLTLNDKLVNPAQPVTITTNGLTSYTGPMGTVTLYATLQNSGAITGWSTTDTLPTGLRKKAGLEGPIGDAYNTKFIVVYGTAGSSADTSANQNEADAFCSNWNYWMLSNITSRPDTSVTAADIASSNLILYGTAQSNSILANIQYGLPIQVSNTGITVGGRTFPCPQYGAYFVYPNPQSPTHYVVVSHGTMLGTSVQDLEALPWYWPDYVIYDATTWPNMSIQYGLSYLPSIFVDAGYFDTSWGLNEGTACPDLLIRAQGQTDYLGGNVYNLLDQQTLTQAAVGNSTATYEVQVRNNGAIDDSFVLTATPSGNGVTVTCIDESTSADITSQITSQAGWCIPLDKGAARTIQVSVKLDATVPTGATRNVLVTATSAADNTKLDQVQAATISPTKQGDWWMFQHDPQHTGRSPFNGPNVPVKKWTYSAGGHNDISTPPVLAADGTIYVGSSTLYGYTADNKLVAFNPDGTLKWTSPIGAQIPVAPAIGSDGTIYVYAGSLYAINPDGTQKWVVPAGGGVGAPMIGSDGTIYVGGGTLSAFRPDGTKKWSAGSGYSMTSPVMGADGTVYVACADLNIYAFNPNGTTKWTFPTPDYALGSPAIGADGTIYFGCDDHKFYALTPGGIVKWTFTTGGTIQETPAIGKDGTIYFTSNDKMFYALNADGTQKWAVATSNGHFSPAISADGTVYISGDNMSALNPDGTTKWSLNKFYAAHGIAIGADGTIYTPVADTTGIGSFCAIGNVPYPVFSLTKSASLTSALHGNTVTYTLAYANNGTTATNTVLTDVLPANITYVTGSASNGGTYNAATRTLTWSLGALATNQSGQVSFNVTVDTTAPFDGTITNTASIASTEITTPVASNTASFIVTRPPNSAPTLNSLANMTLNENVGAQTVPLSGIGVGSADDAGQTLTITATSNNTTLIPTPTVTYTSPQANGSLSFTPAAYAFGTATITVKVQDNGGTANGGVDTVSRSFTVTVKSVNCAPTIDQLGDQTLREDAGPTSLTLTGITAGGEAGQALTVTALSDTPGILPNPTVQYTSPQTTATLTLQPQPHTYGAATVTVTVRDDGGTANGGKDTTTMTFAVSVNYVNDAPTLDALPDQAINENAGLQTVHLTGITSGGIGEEDWQTVTVTATSDTPALIPAPTVDYTSPDTTGTLTYTPATGASGTAHLTVLVQDDGGTADGGVDTTAVTFTVTVRFVNTAPTLNPLANLTMNENAGQQTVTLTGISAGDADDAGQTLTVTATSTNTGLIPTPTVTYTSPNATGTLTFTPVANQYGTATLTVTVRDNGGTANGGVDTVTRPCTVTVNLVNHAPTLDPIPDQSVDAEVGQQTLTLTGIGPGGAGEESGQIVTVTATSGNPALIANPTVSGSGATRTLSYRPVGGQEGSALITVTAKDNGGTANGGVDTTTRTLTITVVRHQPDLGIRTASEGTFTGLGSTSSDGSGQTKTQVVLSTDKAVYYLALRNAGDGNDTLTLTPSGDTTGWAITASTVDALGNVLAPISLTGGWATGTLLPGQTCYVKVEVAWAGPAGAPSTCALTLTVASSANPAKVDVAKAITTLRRGPDMRVHGSADIGYLGTGIFNLTGLGQTSAVNLTGTSTTYTVRISNVDVVSDHVTVKAPAVPAGWKARYLLQPTNTDITAKITSAAGWTSDSVGPQGMVGLLVVVNPNAYVKLNGSATVTLTATSANDPANEDVVKAITTRK